MLYIRTKYGHQYHVNKNGEIKRLDMPELGFSDTWHLIGIEHVRTRNYFLPFEAIEEWLNGHPSLHYKNGNPQYTVRDHDHGTVRRWGDRIDDIRIIEGE